MDDLIHPRKSEWYLYIMWEITKITFCDGWCYFGTQRGVCVIVECIHGGGRT